MKDIPFHPYSEDYPLMPPHDMGRLEEGMRARGFDPRFPIILYKKQILDGRNRYMAANAAGVTPTFIAFKGADEQARLFVQTANEERRHLNAEWLQRRRQERIPRVVAARQDGDSLRTIAAAENVSESQIRGDIKAASTAQGCAVEPADGIVTGRDGKDRPATKPPRNRSQVAETLCDRCARLGSAVEGCTACIEARKGGTAKPDRDPGVDEEPAAPTDTEGHPLTLASEAAFAALAKFAAIDSHLRAAQKLIDEVSQGPGGEQLRRCLTPTGPEGKTTNKSDHLQGLKRDLKGTRPHSVCPWCKGTGKAGCKGCQGTAWVTLTTWKDAPADLKARLA